MLFIANTIATIIKFCTPKIGVQHSQQSKLLLFVVCVVIVTMICIIISPKTCNKLTKNSQQHQQQEERLYEFDNDYLIATSNHNHRIGSHGTFYVLTTYCFEFLRRNEKSLESLITSTEAPFTSYIQNCLKRLMLGSILLLRSTKQGFRSQCQNSKEISFHIFYTSPVIDVPNHHYFYFIFILVILFRYLLSTMFTFITVFVSINSIVTRRIIYFVYSRIYGTSFKLHL